MAPHLPIFDAVALWLKDAFTGFPLCRLCSIGFQSLLELFPIAREVFELHGGTRAIDHNALESPRNVGKGGTYYLKGNFDKAASAEVSRQAKLFDISYIRGLE